MPTFSHLAPLKIPYVVKEGACWDKCGKKLGPCEDYCGKNNFCCKKGHARCVEELINVIPDEVGSSMCVGWKGESFYCSP